LSSARAAETPRGGDPGSDEDVQDVLFLHDSRPLLIRLHIRVDGKPYALRWKEYLMRWFRFLDRDEDGFLDGKEAERAPHPHALELLMSDPSNFTSVSAPDFEEFDRDRDKRVSLDEFLRFYRSSSAGPVRLAPPSNQPIQGVSQDALNDALYKLLDSNKDGKLSRSELAGAAKILRKFDGDDDELLTLQELQSALPAPALSVVGPGRPVVPPMQAPAIPLLLVPREDAPRRLDARLPIARAVLKRYDKNNNKSLSREEIGMPKEMFDRLDANKNDELDVFELLRWILVTPDIECVVYLGRVAAEHDAIEPMGEQNAALEQKGDHTLTYSTADHCLNLLAAPSVAAQTAQSMRQGLIQQFKAIDQKQKGFLTRKQLQMPQFSSLRSILDVADSSNDNCLDLEELTAWLDLAASGRNCQISVALAASGRGLFSFLDADRDGRLSLRELANPWQRLAGYARDGEGGVTRGEIPLQYQIVVNPGAPNYLAGQLGGFQGQSRRGPLWFRKMDRNGDGDVSPREFLGSRADFRRLDTDGDGLISLDEARQADAALRKK
jgi:Ca2+-binding EF-hand superfamily protein